LSGDPAALEAILNQLRRRDIFCALVKVDFASHSPQMDPLRADLLDALEGLAPRPAEIPIYSTVTGMAREGIEFDGRYWARNLREPVLFSGAVQRLLEDGYDTFVEISPHPALLSAIQQGLNHLGREGAVVASMRRDDDERAVMLGSLGALYSLGYPVDWSRIYPRGGRCVRLPPHPWRRERCWMEIAAGEDDSRLDTYGGNSLLGNHARPASPALSG
jgi:myxalamid-type polyketide synthase MxaE and MxaD